jgi:hypothetical protein
MAAIGRLLRGDRDEEHEATAGTHSGQKVIS